ncbi:MAG: hypothetical protein KF753_25335, partial [Caldilineaceae bacterium]|nr:hypothetical protein [Caldilineaceae bacterium]
GGRGWKRSDAPEAAYQSIAISPSFHSDGVVLAGTEEQGLYRSADSGLSFTLLEDAPSRINSLVPLDGGWLLSDEEQLWRSADGITWQAVAGSAPALVLTPTSNGILAGTENGVQLLDGESLAVVESYGVVETA